MKDKTIKWCSHGFTYFEETYRVDGSNNIFIHGICNKCKSKKSKVINKEALQKYIEIMKEGK